MKTKELYNSISIELQSIYSKVEADNIAFLLLAFKFGITKTDIIVDRVIDNSDYLHWIETALLKLKDNEPIQYVIGTANFYGRDFKVDSSVLIPRNETEELVQLIINEHAESGLRLLDIGTGSGCIPITLFHELNQPEIEAIDVSAKALSIAKDNAKALKATVAFHEQDILDNKPLPNTYDIIVSNPPYVTQSEKSVMRKNVLDHEPHLALFVADNDPLIFYRVIAQKAVEQLNNNGKLYFEINEQLGNGVANEMEKTGFSNIQIIKDLNNKDRIARGIFRY